MNQPAQETHGYCGANQDRLFTLQLAVLKGQERIYTHGALGELCGAKSKKKKMLSGKPFRHIALGQMGQDRTGFPCGKNAGFPQLVGPPRED